MELIVSFQVEQFLMSYVPQTYIFLDDVIRLSNLLKNLRSRGTLKSLIDPVRYHFDLPLRSKGVHVRTQYGRPGYERSPL